MDGRAASMESNLNATDGLSSSFASLQIVLSDLTRPTPAGGFYCERREPGGTGGNGVNLVLRLRLICDA